MLLICLAQHTQDVDYTLITHIVTTNGKPRQKRDALVILPTPGIMHHLAIGADNSESSLQTRWCKSY